MEVPPGAPGLGIVPRLLGYRLRMLWNAALRAGRERRSLTLLLVTGVAGGMLLGYRVSLVTLRVDTPTPARIEPALAGGLAMVAGFTAVTAITFTLGALYFARDVDTLLTSPLRPRAIILTKLCAQLGTGAGIGAILATPPLLAYCVLLGRVWTLPLVGLAVVGMAAVPLAAGTALTIAAVRLIPSRRVRDGGGLLVTGVVFGVTALNLLLRGPDAFSSGAYGALDPSRRSAVASAAWLPTGWATRSISAALRGDVGAALTWLTPLLAAAVVTMLLVARFGERAFVIGYQRSAEAGGGRRRRATVRTRVWRSHGGARALWAVLAVKDLREIRRNPAQLGQLLLPICLFAFYIAYIAAPGSRAGPTAGTRLPSWFGIALTAGFASLFAASGVALRGVGSEGRRLWVLRSAPIEVDTVLRAKLAVGFGVAAPLGLTLLWVGALRAGASPLHALAASGRLLTVIAGLVALATGLGAVRPRLDWTDPRRSVGLGLSLLFMALGSAYLGLCFVILGLPYSRSAPGHLSVAAADAALVLVAAATAAVALRLGAGRLRVLEL